MTEQQTQYLGVTRIHGKGDKPYAATVAPMGKFFFADTFNTALDAALAYDMQSLKAFGRSAALNFPDKARR